LAAAGFFASGAVFGVAAIFGAVVFGAADLWAASFCAAGLAFGLAATGFALAAATGFDVFLGADFALALAAGFFAAAVFVFAFVISVLRPLPKSVPEICVPREATDGPPCTRERVQLASSPEFP
jgi:hypothetical protein